MDQISTNPYDEELEALYAAITGRPAFRYDPGRDPLYRSYAERYVQNGRMAMRDTQGAAAALTGGYGSSYAQAAGQQQYDEYLRGLAEAMPQLYEQAYQQYRDQGQALRDAYDLNWQRREDDYQRGRDALDDQRYEDQQAAAAEQQEYKRRTDAYNRLYRLISATGYSPSDAELLSAGISRSQANALRQEYLRAKGLLPGADEGGGGGGGSRRSSKKKEEDTGYAKSSGTLSSSLPAAGGKSQNKILGSLNGGKFGA